MVISQERRKFSVVVAVCKHTRGIGANGRLPWSLRGDMQYFKQLTRSTADPLKRNAVIMGRKTWQSIPEKMRPLADRINVVISRNGAARAEYALPEGVVLAPSLEAALDMLSETNAELQQSVESVFVIGGASLYGEALQKPELCERVLLTEVVATATATAAPRERANDENAKITQPLAESAKAAEVAKGEPEPAAAAVGFTCDTFFPPMAEGDWRLVRSSDEKTEGAASYRFLSYEPTAATSADGAAAAAAASAPAAASTKVHEEQQYLELVRDVIANGAVRPDRTGVGTVSRFGAQMRFSLRESFPLLTTKSVFWRGVAEELLWFLSGDTSAKSLQDKKIKIWDGNSSREYLDSIGLTEREVGDLGPVYGWQWRHFGAKYKDMHTDYTGQGVDQLAQVIEAIKKKPHDRRIIMSAWNPADLNQMALPPCHMFAQFYVANGELSCQMYQRSADLGLGVPFNIASYALLTCLLAHVTGLKRGDFIHVIGDAHVYNNHIGPLQEQLEREPRLFPQLRISEKVTSIEECTFADLELIGYHPHGKIKMDMAV